MSQWSVGQRSQRWVWAGLGVALGAVMGALAGSRRAALPPMEVDHWTDAELAHHWAPDTRVPIRDVPAEHGA